MLASLAGKAAENVERWWGIQWKKNVPPAYERAVAREVSLLCTGGLHVLGVVNVERKVLDRGNDDALRAALLFIYDELRRLAHYSMRREPQDHTPQSSALVNEAYLRLKNRMLHHDLLALTNLCSSGLLLVRWALTNQLLVDLACMIVGCPGLSNFRL